MSISRFLKTSLTATLGAGAGLALATGMVWSATNAAFTATTDTSASVTAGTVSLSDNDSGSALITMTNVVPGDSVAKCITVTYDGNATSLSAVELYGVTSNITAALDDEVNITIEEGSGATDTDCTSFAASGTIYASNTVAALALSNGDYTNGITTGFTPTSNGQTQQFRVTTALDSAAPNSAQGGTVDTTLTWEVRSS